MLEVDKTYIVEINKLHHQALPNLEFWREKEKRKTKEHFGLGIGNRREKNEYQLKTTGKDCSE